MKENSTNTYKPLVIKKYAKKSYKNPELRRFKKFRVDKSLELGLTCNGVKICEGNANLVSFFVFDNIHHFDMANDKVITKYPLASDVISAGNLRKDGKIIYSGLVNGKINVYDAGKKNCLRSYNAHKLQVNSLDISNNLVNFVSSSNDLSVKLYDLATTEPVKSYEKAHGDYVKVAKYADEENNLIISTGYDKVIKLWDIRTQSTKQPVKVFKNLNICNDILIGKGNLKGKFISTAESHLNFFDLRSDKIVLQANPFQGSITKLITDTNQTRLFVVPGGESFVKVVDLESLTLRSLYSIKFENELSAFDISGDMNRYAIAFTSGEVSIRSRNFDEDEEDIYKDQEEKDFELLE